MGLSEDGSLGGWGWVLVDAAVGLDRTAVSASPLVPPGLDGTRPSAPEPGSPPSLSLCLAFDATQVVLGSAGGQHGARLGALPCGDHSLEEAEQRTSSKMPSSSLQPP
ncbi:unnamed protein product [Rangifer tarandus platyrhynchus]|uniref:Uncharacterized protein n=1 Tax=Rangifer tarandus platyrhynchus TaxID=3082113 RepID=A0ABN8ZMM3_RANTA|nr:unnamed protein product [Rangifer tarandus platyrhynchus]